MKILKVINNNVVSACDDKGKEIVVMGKGLGFGKKIGDILDESKIEKKFSMPDESVSRLEEILKDIPYEYAQVANRIIAMVKEKFDMKLSKIIYITLTDHLNFAITRFKKGIEVENALLWEIKRFYQKEFEAGKEALEIIKKEQLAVCYDAVMQDTFFSSCSRYITLKFKTPTSFKTNNQYQFYPTTEHILKSLVNKFNACGFDAELDYFEDMEEALQETAECIRNHRILRLS